MKRDVNNSLATAPQLCVDVCARVREHPNSDDVNATFSSRSLSVGFE